MYNWKKFVITDFMGYCRDEEIEVVGKFIKDEVNKEVIDRFMKDYEDTKQLDYLKSIFVTKCDYKDIKKFLYLTFLDKYTNCLDFNNTNEDELCDL